MVPGAPILSRVDNVAEGVTRCYGALGDPWNTIHVHSKELSDSVPMYCCPIVLEIVHHRNVENISPASLDPRSRISVIEKLCIGEILAVRIPPPVSHIEGIVAHDAVRAKCFVVCVDIKLTHVRILQPTCSVFRSRARLPANHVRIIAFELAPGLCTWRPKDWPFAKRLQLW